MLSRALKKNQNGYGNQQYKMLVALAVRSAIIPLKDSL